MPAITLLLRTLNAEPYLDSLLRAIQEQSMRPRELLVVDSGSRDATLARVREAGARVVTLPQAEFTHARSTNLGFSQAQGDIVAMLSQDALPVSGDWLQELVRPFEDPHVAAVFGRQIPRPGCFPLERWELERSYPAGGEPLVAYSNVNSAARRSVWNALPFDESVRIAEDRLWAMKARDAGHRVVYAPGAAVLHSHRYTVFEVFGRCREEAMARRQGEGRRDGWNLLFKAWPKQSVKDARRLIEEGHAHLLPVALAYRFAQFAGMVAGGRG